MARLIRDMHTAPEVRPCNSSAIAINLRSTWMRGKKALEQKRKGIKKRKKKNKEKKKVKKDKINQKKGYARERQKRHQKKDRRK